jgi:diguanylate cyclase (GGDEF)-like protein
VIGWITLGFPIDDALLGEVKQLSTVDVVLLLRQDAPPRWEPMRSTIEAASSLALIGPWRGAREAANGGAADTEPARTSLEFDARPTTMLAVHHRLVAREVALTKDAGGPVMALVLRSIDEAKAPYDRLTWILMGCTVAGIAVFGIGSAFTARRITTPLNRLARSARRLSEGDYDAPVAIKEDDEIGALAGAFETMRQAVQEREREVTRIAFEDSLTALPNRERLRVEVRRAMEQVRANGGGFALLRLDLARFEQVNEVLGQRFGDSLLREVSQRLLAGGRRDADDIVARVGSNEFALLLPGADAPAAMAVAERIHRLLEQPIRLEDHTIDLHGSVGIACHPGHASEADALINRCAIAMQNARRRGMGLMLYDSAMDASSAESLSLMSELRHALAHDQLRLYLQPKIALATGAVIGAEALVRWQHPQRGLVPPMQFIPFAEQSGFIRELTAWMLARGTRMLRQLNTGAPQLKLSVNLSTRDLMDQDLPAKLRDMVVTQGIEPRRLCLEITESAIMDDPQRAMQTLEALHGIGFRLSIDDFGTGYSSLAYLKSMPVDELKIDKSFVMNMERDLDDAKIVRSTVDLAHNLGLTVVAEGVETAKAWKLLQSLKCDEAQGYFIAKPMPEALFADWIAQWQSPAMNAVRLDTDFAQLAT